jgi:hypothetical protein
MKTKDKKTTQTEIESVPAGSAGQQAMVPVGLEAFHRLRTLAEVGEKVESGELATLPPGHVAVPAELAQRMLGSLSREATEPEQQAAKLGAIVAALRRRGGPRVGGAASLVDAPAGQAVQ